MRRENGYGSVIKLNGTRRKPWAVRKRTGYKDNGTCVYEYIGYYATRKEAEMGLAEYNKSPFTIKDAPSLRDVWEQYVETDFKQLAANTQRTRRTYFAHLKPLHDVKMKDLKPMMVQEVLQSIGSPSVQKMCRCLYSSLELFALKNEYITRQFSATLNTASYTQIHEKRSFTEEQIEEMWNAKEQYPFLDDVLILIYTGFRISEYVALKKSSIQDGCLCGGCKTEAGKNRLIPIHHRIKPLIDKKVKTSPSDSLHTHISVESFRNMWKRVPMLDGYSFHECRHTFRTRLDNANANEVSINLLMGHAGDSVGKRVYTHKTIEQLRNTIELMQ